MEADIRALAERLFREGQLDVTDGEGRVRRVTPSGIGVMYRGVHEIDFEADAYEVARELVLVRRVVSVASVAEEACRPSVRHREE